MSELRECPWRISRSGYSIKDETGRIVAAWNKGRCQPFDEKSFGQWLDDAGHICWLHNAALSANTRPADAVREAALALCIRIDAEGGHGQRVHALVDALRAALAQDGRES